MQGKSHTDFLGTYFDKDAVLRAERWVRVIAWAVLAAYIFESGFSLYQAVTNAITNNYPVDPMFLFGIFTRILQGGVLTALLYIAGKLMLILLDIEDNTRRTGRK